MLRVAVSLLVVSLSQADDTMDTFKVKDIAGCTTDELASANAAQQTLYDCDAGIIGKQEVQDYQEALLGKEDPVLAGKIMIDAMHTAITSGSYADVSKSLCGCMAPYVSELPSCGDIGDIKSNMTAFMPYCDVSAKCPDIDMKPVVEMAVLCYNQSGDELCAKDSDHPCIGAARPLFEPAYIKSMLDCTVTVDMDIKQFMSPGFQTNMDFTLATKMMAERPSKMHFEDVKDGLCYLQNMTKGFKVNTTEGPACEDDKAARKKVANINYNTANCMTTPSLDAHYDVPGFMDTFVDHNDTDARVKHVAKYIKQMFDTHPSLVGEQCGCLRGAYKEYEVQELDCGKYHNTYEGLHTASDFCTVVDNCNMVDPNLFIDILQHCKSGDKDKEPDTIVGQLCDPSLEKDTSGEYNLCHQAIEKIFTENVPINALNCLYHSSINFNKLINSARDQGTEIPDNLNVTSLLEAALDNEGLLTFDSVKNIICAVAWEDPNEDEGASYDEDFDYGDFDYGDEEPTSPVVLAGGAAAVLAVGFALYTMLCKRPPPTIEDANEDEEDNDESVKKGSGEDSKGLISNDDEDIL